MAGEAREKCAIAAVITPGSDYASLMLRESLLAQQHRGPEASGIASETSLGGLEYYRAKGLTRDVFSRSTMESLAGSLAIGHNRYSTNGSKGKHLQPIVDESVGLAFAHNGNLPTTAKLEDYLGAHNLKYQNANDSEMMGMAIAQEIRGGLDLAASIEKSFPLFTGAFSCVAMHDGIVAAFRDANGIRPLSIGQFAGGKTVSSETCGLDIIGAEFSRDVAPGELVIITPSGIESHQVAEGKENLDMFEFVYFARHDSQLYGMRVNEVRRRFGERLALEQAPLLENGDNIVVVPVPDTSVPEAEGFADTLGLRHSSAIIKNRYIGRTFMKPSEPVQSEESGDYDEAREQMLRRKHNIIPEAVDGKDVILIDDSIVRLNTMPRIVELLHGANAKSVSVLIGSPPVRFPDFYGIDTADQSELAAAHMTVEQMRQKIDCEHLGFLSLGGMVEATGLSKDKFNLSCFTGEYPIDIGHNARNIAKPVSMEFVE